jgi:predicted GNAT family acetyltransferase
MEHKGKVVGTATTITYASRFAWIGMVLVDPEYRKQGIGTALLKKTIEYLDSSQIATMKLDATPQGKPIYARLGFIEEYEIERWILHRWPGTMVTTLRSTCAPLGKTEREQFFRLDKELFAADRSPLLCALCEKRLNLRRQFGKTDCRRATPSDGAACLPIILGRGWRGPGRRRKRFCKDSWPNRHERQSS